MDVQVSAVTPDPNGFTTKELLIKVWDEVREFSREAHHRFDKIEVRVDSLEGTRDQGSGNKRIGWMLAAAIVALTVGSIVGNLLAGGPPG